MTDKNALSRNFKILKLSIRIHEKLKNEIIEIQEELDNIDWDEENRVIRGNLYQKLGKRIGIFRGNRIVIEYNRERFLKQVNLTG